MANIAVDIDSTLYDFETPAREAFFKLAEKYDDKTIFKGAYSPWTEWRAPADACGIDIWLEAIALCHDRDAILAQVPFSGAVETCQALQAEGHELLYISNRATEASEATEEWLTGWDFLGEHTQVLALTGDKKPHMASCQYLIDDRPKTVIEFTYDAKWEMGVREDAAYLAETEGQEQADDFYAANRRRAFVKAYQYNQGLTDVPNLYLAPTWAGLNYYLVGKGVLSEPAVQPALKV